MAGEIEERTTTESTVPVKPEPAKNYVWKLRVTCAVLVLWAIACVASLWTLVQYEQLFSPRQLWSLSALDLPAPCTCSANLGFVHPTVTLRARGRTVPSLIGLAPA